MTKDSIDRQAIFTIVEHRYPDVVDGQYRVGYADAINDVLKDISYMPSTQLEIIRCKDSIVYRKDVVEALYQALRTQLQGTFTDSMSLAMSMAQALPSAEPEQKKGKWIDDQCSNCGYGVNPWNNTPYCPNCGAKMEGDNNEIN